jgi:hypothetical protein
MGEETWVVEDRQLGNFVLVLAPLVATSVHRKSMPLYGLQTLNLT